MGFKDKREIRKLILKKRDSIPIEVRKEWDGIIMRKLIKSNYYSKSKIIFTFVSFGTEVDTHEIIRYALKDGKTVCVPKIPSKERGIEVFEIKGFEDLKAGYYNILEPVEGCKRIEGEDIDLILMPGVAFDREGGRIGYGGGFYDRFLKDIKKPIPKIALAYGIQLVEKVPAYDFDVKIDGIITNEGIIVFSLNE